MSESHSPELVGSRPTAPEPSDRLEEIRREWADHQDADEPIQILDDVLWLIAEVDRLRAFSVTRHGPFDEPGSEPVTHLVDDETIKDIGEYFASRDEARRAEKARGPRPRPESQAPQPPAGDLPEAVIDAAWEAFQRPQGPVGQFGAKVRLRYALRAALRGGSHQPE